jgi:hypothetical protein
MAIDLIHDSKAAVSDLSDRSLGGAASSALGYSAGDELPSAIAQGDAGSGLTGGDSANPQTSLTSSLGSEDGAGAPSYHSGLVRPVTVSFLPPPANVPGSDAGPGLAFSPPSIPELFTFRRRDTAIGQRHLGLLVPWRQWRWVRRRWLGRQRHPDAVHRAQRVWVDVQHQLGQ